MHIIFPQPGKASEIMALVTLILVLGSCNNNKSKVPSVATGDVSSITYTTAVSGGNVTGDGGDPVLSRGVCWSTSAEASIVDNRTAESGTTGSFTSNLSNLEPGTKYYLRAYASNKTGTGYGKEITFSTSKIEVPSLTTAEAISICQKTAMSGGTIISDNGSTIVSRGICWSKDHDPTLGDSIKISDSGLPSFTAMMRPLDVNETYYVRAWATNRAGTSYGNEITLKTLEYGNLSDLDNNPYRTIIIGSQEWMADNLRTTKYSNGETIPNITTDDEWNQQIDGAFCWYENNESSYKNLYGALYNWYTVADIRGICPAGWHVPGDADWTVLTDYLTANGYGYGGSGEDIAKSLSATLGWTVNSFEGTVGNDQPANNWSGFEAVPGGVRIKNGPFAVAGYTSSMWSASEHSFTYGNAISLSGEFNSVFRGYTFKQDGGAVRCLKDL